MPKLTAGENVTLTINVGADTLTAAVTSEAIRDLVAAFVVEGTGIDVVHDDTGNTLTITATGPDAEAVRDLIGSTLVAGSGITKAIDDALDTVTLSVDAEAIMTLIASIIVAGTGITADVDDDLNTITISAPANLTAEDVRDTIGAALVAGTNVTITVSDVGDTITIDATGGGGGLTQEQAEDAIATMVVAGIGIDVAYNDTTPSLTIDVDQEVTLNFVVGTGSGVVATGIAGMIEIGDGFTIQRARIVADQSGSIVIDIKKAAYASVPTFTSICASAKPTLSSAQKSSDATLTGWTTGLSEGDWLQFVVDSATIVTRATLSLLLRRTS